MFCAQTRGTGLMHKMPGSFVFNFYSGALAALQRPVLVCVCVCVSLLALLPVGKMLSPVEENRKSE